MNILITGGLGLIGHNVVKRLQDKGHLVSIVDSKTNYGIIPQDELDYLMTERRKKLIGIVIFMNVIYVMLTQLIIYLMLSSQRL